MITDHLSLRVALRQYIDRDDLLDDTLKLFIDNARREIAGYRLFQQDAAVISLLLGASSIAALPADFLEMRAVERAVDNAIIPKLDQFAGSSHTELGYRTYSNPETSSLPGPIIEVQGMKAGESIRVLYTAMPSALVADTDTNAVLKVHGDLWLWLAVAEAARYLRNEEMAQAAGAAIADLGKRASDQARRARQYSGPRQMKVRI